MHTKPQANSWLQPYLVQTPSQLFLVEMVIAQVFHLGLTWLLTNQ